MIVFRFISICSFICLLAILQLVASSVFATTVAVPAVSEVSLTVVSASGGTTLRAVHLTTPEQWVNAVSRVYPETPDAPNEDTAVLVKYPFSRYAGFRAMAKMPVDALFVDTSGQVVGVMEQVADDGFHAFEQPIIAMLFLSAGTVRERGFRQGNLVLQKEGTFDPSGMGTPTELHVLQEQVMTQLQRSAKRYVRSAEELGAFYLEQRDYEKARNIFSKLVKSDGVSAHRIGLAMALSGAGQVDDAIAMLVAVVESDGTNEDAYLKLARIFHHVRKTNSIVTVLAAGVTKFPELLNLRLELAKLYLEIGQLDVAMRVLNGAPKTELVQTAQLARVRGDIYLRQGRHEDAAAAYAAYLKVFPSAPHAAELRLYIARHKKGEK